MVKFKSKHNKKRNTAFLYEVLVKELTKCILEKDEPKKDAILSLLKEFFHKKSILGEELKLYKTLAETYNVDHASAEKIMFLSEQEHKKLDKKKIFDAQSTLNAKLKEIFSSRDIFNIFIPSYKTLASINQIFSSDIHVKSKVLLENELVQRMVEKKEEVEQKNLEPIDNLVLKSFVKKFNEEYGKLYEEQVKLLNKYIFSFNDDVELKVYLNEELARLKKSLTEIKEKYLEEDMKNNLTEVFNILEKFSSSCINEDMIEVVLKTQNLIREINNDDQH